MLVKEILYHPKFIPELLRLSLSVQKRAIKTEQLFRQNPLHPSLRLHPLQGKLKGTWSISVTMGVRILFTRLDDGKIVFYSIGSHDIYKLL